MAAPEADDDHLTPAPQLALIEIPPLQAPPSPEPPGMLTPPLHTLASVPFRWEEEPGKPRPCTALIPFPKADNLEPKCLELPPRLYSTPESAAKTPSPNTVLDGPYLGSNRFKFSSSSFRFLRNHHHHHHHHQGSFDSSAESRSPERGQLNTVVLGKKVYKGKGLFGSWGRRNPRKDVNGSSSFVFPSSMDATDYSFDEGSNTKVKIARFRRNGSSSSLSSQTRSHLWAALYEGFKQVMPWKSRKSKKETLVN